MENKKRLEEKFQDFIKTEPKAHFFYIHDLHGVFTYVSANITELLGYSPESFKKNYSASLTNSSINKHAILHT